jgi:hypothetical protein
MDETMNFVFRIVADGLRRISSATGFSYNEINIIAYYIILPFIYVTLADRILRKHQLKITYVVFWLVLISITPNFKVFSDALFKHSVDFLLFFGRFGLDYVSASVVICVVLPGLAFSAMCFLAFPSLRLWKANTNSPRNHAPT